MSFVLVEFDFETQTVDFATDENGYISLEGGLQTPVLYSLLSNRRARPSDDVDGDPMGWWADEHPDVPGDLYGSHIWVVHDSGKLTTQDLRRTVVAGEQGLAWMVVDGLSSRVAVTATRVDPDILRLFARIERPNGEPYQAVWEVHARGI